MGVARLLITLLVGMGTASGAAEDIALSFKGTAMQGALVTARTVPGASVTVDDRPARVSPEGWFLIGIGRDDAGPVTVRVTTPDGRIRTEKLAVQSRVYDVQRIDGLPETKVTPPPEVLDRIRREAAMAAEARTRDDPRTDFLAGFIWPLDGPITGVYGSQRILNGEPRRPHFGVDVAAPVGTPVKAPADAVITLVHPDMYYSGGTLIMDHGHGLSSTFIHLSRILVSEGQHVRQGDIVAEVGATGRATGPHLDWRINLFDTRLDPELVAPPRPVPGDGPDATAR